MNPSLKPTVGDSFSQHYHHDKTTAGAFMKSNPRLILPVVALAAALGVMAACSQTAAYDQNRSGAKAQVHPARALPDSNAPHPARVGTDAGADADPEVAANPILNRWIER